MAAAVLQKLIDHVLKSIPEVNSIINYCLDAGTIVGASAVVGGVIMGSNGLFIGAAVGGITSAVVTSGRFRSIRPLIPSIIIAVWNGIRNLSELEILNLVTEILEALIRESNINSFGSAMRPMVQ